MGHDVAMVEDGEPVMRPVQPNLLRRAIRNLVDNAVDYAGAARVAVRAAGEQACDRGRDDGPGIAPDELARVHGAVLPRRALAQPRDRRLGPRPRPRPRGRAGAWRRGWSWKTGPKAACSPGCCLPAD